MNHNEIINDTIELISEVYGLAGNAVVYRKEVIQLRDYLIAVQKLLKESPLNARKSILYEEHEALNDIYQALKLLINPINMLSENIWLSVAATWNAVQPTNDIFSSVSTISGALGALGITPPNFEVSDDDFKEDYHNIYNYINCISRNNEVAKERLNEINQFLGERNLPKPSEVMDMRVAEVFGQMKQYVVNREDYKVGRVIGDGASAQVFIGQNIKTGKKVAIKQLISTDFVEYELESLKRELAILSSLHHPCLIDFIGATSKAPYWIITEFMERGSLYNCLRKNSLSPYDKTRIAYQTAKGVAYLHSKNIIHRDLKSLNILVSNTNEARVCDFGISRPVDNSGLMTNKIGTFNYMAPEVIMKNKYTLKADVFSYALLLLEMVTGYVPFGGMNQLMIAKQIEAGNMPEIPSKVSQDLRTLIKSCWSHDPEARPTFNQILETMRRKMIAFPGANSNQIADFYASEANDDHEDLVTLTSRRVSLTNIQLLRQMTKDKEIINYVIQEPQNPKLYQLLQEEVINNKNQKIIEQLQKNQFVEKSVENMDKFTDVQTICMSLTYVITSSTFVANFINAGGIDALIKLLNSQDKSKISAATIIIDYIASSIKVEYAITLFDQCLAKKQYKSALHLIDGIQPPLIIETLSKYKMDILNGPASKETGVLFNIYVSSAGFDTELASKINTELVIENQSVEFAQKVCEIKEFTNQIKQEDVVMIIKTISNKSLSPEKRASAVVLATTLPAKVLELLSTRKNFIDDIIAVNNDDVIGRFLFKLSQFSECASYLLDNEDYLREKIRSNTIFALYIRLASFYPARVLKDNFIIKTCQEYLSQKKPKLAEVCFRILGVLSSHEQFRPYAEDTASLIEKLLSDGVLTQIEATLAVGVLYNISSLKTFKSLKPQVLALAETDSPYAGIVLRIASRCKIPKEDGPISGRFIDLVIKFIGSDDKYGRIAACEILLQVADMPNYKHAIELSSISSRINYAMETETQQEIFIKLAKVSEAYEFSVTAKALNSCDLILTKQGQLNEELRSLRASLYRRLSQ